MKKVPLTQGKVTLVSDEDYGRVSQFKWRAVCVGRKWYAATYGDGPRKTRRQIYLHRFILDAPKGVQVDHADGDGLNNCRDNLRLCTHSENMRNTGKQKNNTSGYKGVSWNKVAHKWVAMICIDGKPKYIGSFDAPEDAAHAYDEAATSMSGEFAYTNF